MKKLLIGVSIIGLLIMPIISSNAFTTDANAMDLPSWVENSKVKGDLRVRFQSEEKSDDLDRDRWRVRWRLGVVSSPNDQWKVGFGFASGGDDPRSTNQTFDNLFETGNANLDYAYAQYTPMDEVSLLIGKFKNPIWNPKDLLWDGDIRPEGLAATLSFNASENVSLFLTPAYFILDEFKDTDNPDLDPEDDARLIAVQGGLKANLADSGYAKLGATYYSFMDVDPNWEAGDVGAPSEQVDADAFSVEAEAGLTGLPVFLAVYGQYVSLDPDEGECDDDTGYLIGVKFGDKKVKKLGDWQINYNFRKLEECSWAYTYFSDSDFLGGTKAGEGSEVELKFGIAKNVYLSLDYYDAEEDTPGSDSKSLWQFDLNVKF